MASARWSLAGRVSKAILGGSNDLAYSGLWVRIPLGPPFYCFMCHGLLAEWLCTGLLIRGRNPDLGSTPRQPTNFIFPSQLSGLLAEWLCTGLLIRGRDPNLGSTPRQPTILEVCLGVDVAQLVEHLIVSQMVAGSTPVVHPQVYFPRCGSSVGRAVD